MTITIATSEALLTDQQYQGLVIVKLNTLIGMEIWSRTSASEIKSKPCANLKCNAVMLLLAAYSWSDLAGYTYLQVTHDGLHFTARDSWGRVWKHLETLKSLDDVKVTV